MIDREISSGAAHAGHDLIGNEQHAALPANLGNFLKISLGWDGRAQGSSAYRLENECRRLAIRPLDSLRHFRCVFLTAVSAPVGAVLYAAVAIGNSHMLELANHWQVHFAAAAVAGDCQRPQRGTVVALLAAEDLVALLLADLHLILAGQFDGGFHRLRTTTGEIHCSAAEMLSGKIQQFLCIFLGDGGGELAGVDEFELGRLLGYGSGDFRNPVPDEVHCSGA